MSIAAGTRLGAYEVQDFIGQGAMGVVYRAYHSQLERIGAVKVMQAITPDPDTVARFRHEAQAIAKLRHPNIVDVYDFGEFQGTPYMIVEYIPGGSLAGKIGQGPLDSAASLKYLRGIAAGLDYAHAHGIAHRDVKPANVLLTADDSPVLADFGLAKLMQGSSLKSMTGVTTGTPAYMAPEQVTGAHAGPAADLYSLATMAYEMLTGSIPFDGEGLMEVLYAQVHRYPSPPSARVAALGPDVDAVIMRGLAKDPSQRWESCTAFVDALQGALEQAPAPRVAATMVMAPSVTRTKPLSQPDTVMVTAPVAVAAPPATPPPARRRIDRRIVALAALLLVLLSFGVCAIAAQATTLSVNPIQAAPGETVQVTATHVPANQVGEIQLHSVVHTYPFRADSRGQVEVDMTVPVDAELGDHVVKICWENACHRDAPLRVVSGVAAAPSSSPSVGATASPSPSSTGSGTSPTPGSTPHPTSNPTSNPTSAPKPSPTPTPTGPPASPPPTPYVTLVNGIATLNGFTAVLHYFGGGTWTIYLVNDTLGTTTSKGTVTVPSGNTYFTTPTYGSTGVVVGNHAHVNACSGSTCYSSPTVTVGL